MLASRSLSECGINHVIQVSALVEPRSLGIGSSGGVSALAERFLGHRNLDNSHLFIIGYHVLVKKNISELGISEIEICLTVVIYKHGGVNIIPVALIYKRLADIDKGTRGAVGNADSYCHSAVLLVYRAVHIELSVPLNDLRRPRSVLRPSYIILRENDAVVCPVDHVLGRVAAPLKHGIEAVNKLILIVSGVQVEGVTHYERRGVSRVNIPNDRIGAV